MLRPYSCYMKNVTEERRAVMVRKWDWGFVLALSIMSSTGVIAQDRSQGRSMVISRGGIVAAESPLAAQDRKSTRLNSSHTEIYTLSLHDALPIFDYELDWSYCAGSVAGAVDGDFAGRDCGCGIAVGGARSEEHTSELQSHRDLHSFPTRRSSDLRL